MGHSRQFALLGSGVSSFELPYEKNANEWTLAVSDCYGGLSERFEHEVSALLTQPPARALLQHSATMRSSRGSRKRRDWDRSDGLWQKGEGSAVFTRGSIHIEDKFLSTEEVARFVAWEERCKRTVERSDEKNVGGNCLERGCVAYCGLWQMVQVASGADLRMFINVTERVTALVNTLPLNISAYEYSGRVWPHWATFQHYLTG